jgi:pimeloyl-ACP methyl ester carboxylesterase
VRKFVAAITAIFLLIVLAIGYGSFSENKNTEVLPPKNGATELSGYYEQSLSWKSCGGGFECSSLTVPLDYSNPTKSAIAISVIRLKAADNKLGSLILNPGGPGGSGIQYARAAQVVISDEVRKNFDVVGFDPRGVGQSTPIECLDDKTTDEYIALDGTPDDQTELDQSIAMLTKFGKDCLTNSPELAGFVDTESAAKDVDILRAALGDEKLNWLGKSYGTFLGATYADLFPQNVGRMLLDGAIDPTLSNLKLSEGQARGFDDALARFAADCLSRDDCPFTGTVDSGVAKVQQMLDNLDANPGTLSDGRQFTQAMGVLGVVGGLYDVSYGWTELRKMLGAAFQGNYSGLASSVDMYTSRNSNGTYADNSNDAIMAINCIDRPDRGSLEETIPLVEQWSTFAPVFGPYLAWGNIACSYWPLAATGNPHAITATGSGQILVVGTTHDPATPYVWAQSLASQLSNGVLLTLDGDGHTAYRQGSNCIDAVVDNYFLTGTAKADVVCNDGP